MHGHQPQVFRCIQCLQSLKNPEYPYIHDNKHDVPSYTTAWLQAKHRYLEGKCGTEIQGPSRTELGSLFDRLAAAGKPSVLSLITDRHELYVPSKPQGVPPLLSALFNPEVLGVSYHEQLNDCEPSFPAMTVSEEKAKHVEHAT